MTDIQILRNLKKLIFPNQVIILLLSLFLYSCGQKEDNREDRMFSEKILNISPSHDLLLKKDNAELLNQADKAIDKDSVSPHTIGALSVIINRYYTSPEDTLNRKAAIKAFSMLANIHMSYYIDYPKAYRYLTEARQIAEEDNDSYNLSMLYPGIINLYLVNDTEIEDLHSHVKSLLQEGTQHAIKSGNDKTMAAFVVDIALINRDSNNWGEYAPIIEKISNYNFNDSSVYGEITKKLINGFNNYFSGNYDKAESAFIKVNKQVESLRYGERYLFPVSSFLIQNYEKKKELDKATDTAKNLLHKANENQYKDYILWMNKVISELYQRRGMTDSAEYYHTRFLLLKEEMKKENGYETIKNLDFISEIEKVNNEVLRLSFKRKEQQQQIIIIVSILFVLLIVTLALIFNYLNLKKNHKYLYRKNEEMERREEQHKILRDRWKQEKESFLMKLRSLSSEEINDDKPDEALNSADEENEEKRLMPVYAAILDKLEISTEIYKPGFSLSDLSSLLGINQRLLSRAINVCHKSNFHQLLNEYRIRAASKKMHDPDSGRLTIESIAESVGFKSRTSFATLFKKTIGLTPSEYWKMARTDEKTPNPR